MKKVKWFGREYVVMTDDEFTEFKRRLVLVEWDTCITKFNLEDYVKTKNADRRKTDVDSALNSITTAENSICKIIKELPDIC